MPPTTTTAAAAAAIRILRRAPPCRKPPDVWAVPPVPLPATVGPGGMGLLHADSPFGGTGQIAVVMPMSASPPLLRIMRCPSWWPG